MKNFLTKIFNLFIIYILLNEVLLLDINTLSGKSRRVYIFSRPGALLP